MADNSPAFNPPMNRPIDSDPSIVVVPMAKTDWAFRSSQKVPNDNDMRIKHVKNGQ